MSICNQTTALQLLNAIMNCIFNIHFIPSLPSLAQLNDSLAINSFLTDWKVKKFDALAILQHFPAQYILHISDSRRCTVMHLYHSSINLERIANLLQMQWKVK